MARTINLASDTYPSAPGSGIISRRVVVMDPVTRGNVKYPAAAPEKTSVGVTTQNADINGFVGVQMHGNAPIESDGSAIINPGDYVVCGGGADGRVKSQALNAGSANLYDVIGMCVDRQPIPATLGAIVTVLLGKRPTVAA